jgi:dTDP-4-dehydrorhamnose reductase
LKFAVTGKNGQVVQALVERGLLAGHEIVSLGRPELDLAGEADHVIATLVAARPDVIVSAAAYTAVDHAEVERDLAFAINQAGAAAVAEAARRLNIPLLHLSTDYVFDGAKADAYTEIDATGPTGVYGGSKLAGEEAVLARHDDVVILRTAWVYSPFGANFLKTMLRLAGGCEEVRVVADQRGNPTSALDIADGIISVAQNLVSDANSAQRGIFHMAGSGDASWAEFAQAIFETSAATGGPTARVRAIDTADYPTLAKRPVNSTLSSEKLARIHGVRLPDWRQSMADVVLRLVRDNA